MLVSALGGDRESVGDAIYGALTSSLVCIKERNDIGKRGKRLEKSRAQVFLSFFAAGFLYSKDGNYKGLSM